MYGISIVLLAGILVSGCAAGLSSPEKGRISDPGFVVGKTWQWESTLTSADKVEVPCPERYTFHLKKDGTVQARFDCNKGGGDYAITEGGLSFGPLISTRMACPPGSLDGRFMQDLQRVVSFFVEDDALFLELPMDSGTMKFRRR